MQFFRGRILTFAATSTTLNHFQFTNHDYLLGLVMSHEAHNDAPMMMATTNQFTNFSVRVRDL